MMLSQKMATLRATTEENSNLINSSCTKQCMLAANHITFMVEYMPISTAVTFLAVSASCNVFISGPYSLSGLCTHFTTQPSISAIYCTTYGSFQQGSASSMPVKNTTVFGTSITFHLSVLNCTFVQVIVNSSVFVVLSGCDCVIFQNL